MAMNYRYHKIGVSIYYSINDRTVNPLTQMLFQYQTLARRLLPAHSRDTVSFSEINSLISSHMAGILLPSSLLSSEEGEEEEVTSQLLELDQVCTTSLRSNSMMDSAVYSTQGF